MKLQTILLTLLAFCMTAFQLQAESIVREFPADRGQKLDLDLSIGADISIQGWNEDKIQVKVTSDDDADDYDMRFIRNSWGLKVEAEYTKKFGAHRGDIEVVIRVPYEFDLALRTLGGDIELENIKGTFKGKTLGGDIELISLKGLAELSTLGGDVEVSDSELDGLLKTMGGDVEFEDVSGSVQGKTLGGEVSYNNYRPREQAHDRDWDRDRDERYEDRELSEEQRAYLKERASYDNQRRTGRDREEYNRDREEYERDREEYRREREEYEREREEYRKDREEYRKEREERARELAEQRLRDAEERRREADERRRDSESARWDRDYSDFDNDNRGRNLININKMGGDIHVPSAKGGAKVKTMGGDIEVNSADDFVVATTFGGDIDLREVNGWVEAKTYGGDISVELIGNERYGKRDVTLTSYSGSIELVVPEDFDMNIDIELGYTKNYDEQPKIISDFELDIKETKEWEKDQGQAKRFLYAKGEEGNGRHTITIKTVNGNVYLKQK